MDIRRWIAGRRVGVGLLMVMALVALSGCTVVSVPTSEEGGGLTADALRNATYHGIYQHQAVQLTDGAYEGDPFVEGGASRPTVTFTGDVAYGDLNGDGVRDAAVVLVENSGGSGNFLYLAAVINRRGSADNVATHLLGDRAQIRSITIEAGEIAVEMVTHGPDDPMCCPSLETVARFRLQGDQLAPLAGLEGTEWVLVSYGDADDPRSALEGSEVTARFEGGQVGGSAGCNRYFGGFTVDGQNLSISTIGSTKMACDEGLMAQEQRVLTALQTAERYRLEGDLLRITSSDGQVLTFVARESAD